MTTSPWSSFRCKSPPTECAKPLEMALGTIQTILSLAVVWFGVCSILLTCNNGGPQLQLFWSTRGPARQRFLLLADLIGYRMCCRSEALLHQLLCNTKLIRTLAVIWLNERRRQTREILRPSIQSSSCPKSASAGP